MGHCPKSSAARRNAASLAGLASGARQPRGLVTKICAASQPISRAWRIAWAGFEPVGMWRPSFTLAPFRNSLLLVVVRVRQRRVFASRRLLVGAVGAEGVTDAVRCRGAARLDGLYLRQIRPGQRFDAGEAELAKEIRCGAEERGPAHRTGAPYLDDEAVLNQAGQGAVAIDATNELNLRARNGLAVRDHGERFQRGGGELRLRRHP